MIEVDGVATIFVQFHVVGIDIADVPRQADVSHEQFLVVDSTRTIVFQLVVDNVCFEAVVYGGQAFGEFPESRQVGCVRFVVMLPLDVAGRLQFGKVDVDEVRLVQQVRLQAEALVQLREQQLPMNIQRPKATAGAVVQIVDDQFGKIRMVWAIESAE